MFRMTDQQPKTATAHAKRLDSHARQGVTEGLLGIVWECGEALGKNRDILGDLFGSGIDPLKR